MRHDMRHHFHLLERLLNEEQYAEAKAYLQATADSSDTAGMRSFCNDPMINALLQYYADECDNHGIRFEVKAEITQCFAALNDMTVLLGNCLENAVLSCRQLPGERVIRLKIGQVNSTLAILLENSCGHIQLAPSIKQTDGYLPASAFLSEQGEGLGLGSIEHTAKKYDGAAEFRYSPPLFYTRISLEQPNPSP